MSNEIDAQLQSLIDSLEDYLDYRGAWSDQKRTWVAEDIQAYAQERIEARIVGIVGKLEGEARLEFSYADQYAEQGRLLAEVVHTAAQKAFEKAINIVKGGA